ARPEATDEQITEAITQLGLSEWLAGLPHGLATPVGQRGESLSAGERQLVALIRAYIADPDLLILDEATSAVDPATEVRIQHALAVPRGGRGRSAGLRPRPDRPARHPRRTGRPSRRVRGLARLLGAQLRVSSLRSAVGSGVALPPPVQGEQFADQRVHEEAHV